MQHAGLQYGQGAANSHQSPPFAHAADISQSSGGNTTSSLRQFRKKDGTDKQAGPDLNVGENIARVAPHSHYPARPNTDYYRYHQYPDYSSPYKEASTGPPVKYSEIAEPPQVVQPPPIQHVDPVHALQKQHHKDKEFMDMCNISQQAVQHMTAHRQVAAYQDGGVNRPQQGYGPPDAASMYLHNKEQQMHGYKAESQYAQQYAHAKYNMPAPQCARKYAPPPPPQQAPLENDFLAKLQRLNPSIARSIMSDHHIRESQYPPVGPPQYAPPPLQPHPPPPPQNQRYYPNYYYPYNSSCNYPARGGGGGGGQPPPPNRQYERPPSPRRMYHHQEYNNVAPPQKISPQYPQPYNTTPEYAQHYQHRRVPPQEYYRNAPQVSPSEGDSRASSGLRDYIQNWNIGEEEPPSVIQPMEAGGVAPGPAPPNAAAGGGASELYVINSSEISPQCLESLSLIPTENGQYILKPTAGLDSSLVRINIDKTSEEHAVNLQIVEGPAAKGDCMLGEASSLTDLVQQASPIKDMPLIDDIGNEENNSTTESEETDDSQEKPESEECEERVKKKIFSVDDMINCKEASKEADKVTESEEAPRENEEKVKVEVAAKGKIQTISVENDSVIIEMGGAMVQLNISHNNGSKVLSVVSLTESLIIDVNGNYSREDREEIKQTARDEAPAKVPSQVPEELFEAVSKEVAEESEVPEKVPEGLRDEEMSEALTEAASEDTLSAVEPEDVADDVSENLPQDMPKDTVIVTADAAEDASKDMSEDITKDMSEDTAEDITKDMSEDTAKNMTEDTSEDMHKVDMDKIVSKAVTEEEEGLPKKLEDISSRSDDVTEEKSEEASTKSSGSRKSKRSRGVSESERKSKKRTKARSEERCRRITKRRSRGVSEERSEEIAADVSERSRDSFERRRDMPVKKSEESGAVSSKNISERSEDLSTRNSDEIAGRLGEICADRPEETSEKRPERRSRRTSEVKSRRMSTRRSQEIEDRSIENPVEKLRMSTRRSQGRSEGGSGEISEAKSKEISEGESQEMSGERSSSLSELKSREMSEEASENVSEDKSEDVSEVRSEDVPEDRSKDRSEDVPEASSNDISEPKSEDISEETDKISEEISEETHEEMAGVSEGKPEEISEETSEMSEEAAEEISIVKEEEIEQLSASLLNQKLDLDEKEESLETEDALETEEMPEIEELLKTDEKTAELLRTEELPKAEELLPEPEEIKDQYRDVEETLEEIEACQSSEILLEMDDCCQNEIVIGEETEDVPLFGEDNTDEEIRRRSEEIVANLMKMKQLQEEILLEKSARENQISREEKSRSTREESRSTREGTRSAREETVSTREETRATREETKFTREEPRSTREETRFTRGETRSTRGETRSAREETRSTREETKSLREAMKSSLELYNKSSREPQASRPASGRRKSLPSEGDFDVPMAISVKITEENRAIGYGIENKKKLAVTLEKLRPEDIRNYNVSEESLLAPKKKFREIVAEVVKKGLKKIDQKRRPCSASKAEERAKTKKNKKRNLSEENRKKDEIEEGKPEDASRKESVRLTRRESDRSEESRRRKKGAEGKKVSEERKDAEGKKDAQEKKDTEEKKDAEEVRLLSEDKRKREERKDTGRRVGRRRFRNLSGDDDVSKMPEQLICGSEESGTKSRDHGMEKEESSLSQAGSITQISQKTDEPERPQCEIRNEDSRCGSKSSEEKPLEEKPAQGSSRKSTKGRKAELGKRIEEIGRKCAERKNEESQQSNKVRGRNEETGGSVRRKTHEFSSAERRAIEEGPARFAHRNEERAEANEERPCKISQIRKEEVKDTCRFEDAVGKWREEIAGKMDGKSREEAVGKSREEAVGKSREEAVGKSREEAVGKSREEAVGKSREEAVGKSREEVVGKDKVEIAGKSREESEEIQAQTEEGMEKIEDISKKLLTSKAQIVKKRDEDVRIKKKNSCTMCDGCKHDDTPQRQKRRNEDPKKKDGSKKLKIDETLLPRPLKKADVSKVVVDKKNEECPKNEERLKNEELLKNAERLKNEERSKRISEEQLKSASEDGRREEMPKEPIECNVSAVEARNKDGSEDRRKKVKSEEKRNRRKSLDDRAKRRASEDKPRKIVDSPRIEGGDEKKATESGSVKKATEAKKAIEAGNVAVEAVNEKKAIVGGNVKKALDKTKPVHFEKTKKPTLVVGRRPVFSTKAAKKLYVSDISVPVEEAKSEDNQVLAQLDEALKDMEHNNGRIDNAINSISEVRKKKPKRVTFALTREEIGAEELDRKTKRIEEEKQRQRQEESRRQEEKKKLSWAEYHSRRKKCNGAYADKSQTAERHSEDAKQHSEGAMLQIEAEQQVDAEQQIEEAKEETPKESEEALVKTEEVFVDVLEKVEMSIEEDIRARDGMSFRLESELGTAYEVVKKVCEQAYASSDYSYDEDHVPSRDAFQDKPVFDGANPERPEQLDEDGNGQEEEIVEETVENVMEAMVEGKAEMGRVEGKREAELEERVEAVVEERVEVMVEGRVEAVVESRVEAVIEESVEIVEEVVEEIVEEGVEEFVEGRVEETEVKDVEERVDEMEERLEEFEERFGDERRGTSMPQTSTPIRSTPKMDNSWEDDDDEEDLRPSKPKRSLFIDANEFDIKPVSSSYPEDDTLQNYKDVVDLKLSSLSIQIPKAKPKADPEVPIGVLLERFLSKGLLDCGQLERVKRIIEYKRKIEEEESQKAAARKYQYEVYQNGRLGVGASSSTEQIKMSIRRVSSEETKKKKRRFRNLNAVTSDEDEEEDQEYSVYQRTGNGVPKLIIKRKPGLPQPYVKLERSQTAELLVKKRKLY